MLAQFVQFFSKWKAVDCGFQGVFFLIYSRKLEDLASAEQEQQVGNVYLYMTWKSTCRSLSACCVFSRWLTVADTLRDKCTLIYSGNKAVLCEPGTLKEPSNWDVNTGQIYVCVFKSSSSAGVCLLKPLDEAPKCLAPFQTADHSLIIETDFWCRCQFVVIERQAFRYAVKSAACRHRCRKNPQMIYHLDAINLTYGVLLNN